MVIINETFEAFRAQQKKENKAYKLLKKSANFVVYKKSKSKIK